MSDEPGEAPGRYLREGAGLEFDRVSFFSDAVYAIAMTLLVVELHVPDVATAALWPAIRDEWYGIFGFFLGFLLLGRYWLAHHRFFGSLKSIDQRMVAVNLVYLALVAFCPFPIGLISAYEAAPSAFFVFAAVMAGISTLEAVLFWMAVRGGHLRRRMRPATVRFGLTAALLPVGVMLASLPIALWSTTAALLSWMAAIPINLWMERRTPGDLVG